MAAFGWVFVEMDGRSRRSVLIVGVAWGLYAAFRFASTVRQHRELNRLERTLTDEGATVPDEGPISLRFARDRESLVASAIALALIALAFAASWGGWL